MLPDRHLDIEKNIQINWSYQYRYSAIISRSKIVLTVLFCLFRIHLIYILRESIAIQTVLIKHYNHTISYLGLLKTKETFFIMCFYQTSAYYIFAGGCRDIFQCFCFYGFFFQGLFLFSLISRIFRMAINKCKCYINWYITDADMLYSFSILRHVKLIPTCKEYKL